MANWVGSHFLIRCMEYQGCTPLKVPAEARTSLMYEGLSSYRHVNGTGQKTPTSYTERGLRPKAASGRLEVQRCIAWSKTCQLTA